MEIPSEEGVGQCQCLYRRQNSCRMMTSTAGDLTVCTDLTAPHTAQVTLSGGLCCFIFTDIYSLFLSFPLLDLRLGWFRLLRQVLEPCFKGCQRFDGMIFAVTFFFCPEPLSLLLSSLPHHGTASSGIRPMRLWSAWLRDASCSLSLESPTS